MCEKEPKKQQCQVQFWITSEGQHAAYHIAQVRRAVKDFYTYILPDSQGPLIIVVGYACVSSLVILGTPLMSSAILTSKPVLFLKHCQDTWKKCYWSPPTHKHN